MSSSNESAGNSKASRGKKHTNEMLDPIFRESQRVNSRLFYLQFEINGAGSQSNPIEEWKLYKSLIESHLFKLNSIMQYVDGRIEQSKSEREIELSSLVSQISVIDQELGSQLLVLWNRKEAGDTNAKFAAQSLIMQSYGSPNAQLVQLISQIHTYFL